MSTKQPHPKNEKTEKTKSDWKSIKSKHQNKRRFENTGLDEESLREITEKEIIRLT